jgi:hypothetical protein
MTFIKLSANDQAALRGGIGTGPAQPPPDLQGQSANTILIPPPEASGNG